MIIVIMETQGIQHTAYSLVKPEGAWIVLVQSFALVPELHSVLPNIS